MISVSDVSHFSSSMLRKSSIMRGEGGEGSSSSPLGGSRTLLHTTSHDIISYFVLYIFDILLTTYIFLIEWKELNIFTDMRLATKEIHPKKYLKFTKLHLT